MSAIEQRKVEVRKRVNAILDRHFGQAFIDLDELHTHFHFLDEDIIAVLQEDGWDEEAEAFQEMIAEKDPSRDHRDPTPQGDELVTDPMDSDSNRLMEWDLEQRRKARREDSDFITFEWTEVETVRYTCRTTVDRARLQAWLDKERGPGDSPEGIDADMLGWFLSDTGYGSIQRSNREVDPSTDFVDLTVVDE
jgi:hypothetical protein